MTKKQLRQRLEDLYCGVNGGYRFDPENEPSIMAALGPERFSKFLIGIQNTFELKRFQDGACIATAIHNLDEYTDFDNLTQFIWEQLA